MEFETSNRKQVLWDGVGIASLADYKKATYAIINVLKKRFNNRAMTVETPVIELKETFKKIYGEDYSKFVQDSDDLVNEDGKELCLQQYDLVVPFARYVGTNCLKSFNAYQSGILYRDNEKYYQFSFDFAGNGSKIVEVEVVYFLKKVLDELDMGDYKIKLNHKKLLDGMLDISGVPRDKFRTVCSCIDKLQDNQSFDQIKKELIEDEGLDVKTVMKLGWFLSLRGPPSFVLSKISKRYKRFKSAASLMQGLKLLQYTFRVLDRFRFSNKVFLDLSLSLSRCPDYYTGMICEAVLKWGTTQQQVVPIASGGRYDNLIGMFGSKPVTAIGVTIEIEYVYRILEKDFDYLAKVNAKSSRGLKPENNTAVKNKSKPVDKKGDGRKLSPENASVQVLKSDISSLGREKTELSNQLSEKLQERVMVLYDEMV